MLRVLALYVSKGGTGKSTAAANLAAALAARGRRVLVLDVDAQASASRLLGVGPREGLLEVLRTGEGIAELVSKTSSTGVELIAGGAELVQAERLLSREPGAERLLALALEALPRRRWDYVLIDCPPGVGLLSVGALAACSDHLAVIEPSPLAVAGLGDAIELADAVRARLNPRMAPTRILLSRVARTRAARLTSEGLRARFGARVFRAELPERAIAADSAAARTPVVIYEPASPLAQAFGALAEEVDT
jgi:chromosome partitioning protein